MTHVLLEEVGITILNVFIIPCTEGKKQVKGFT